MRVAWVLALVAVVAPSCVTLGSGTVRGKIHTVQRADGSRLQAFAMEPSADAYPAILYLDGSSCASVTEVAQYFPAVVDAGFAIIAPEKRGVEPGDSGRACSREFLTTNDRLQRVEDALLLLDHLKPLLSRWDGRVIVLGASEGGAIAAEIGARYRGTIGVASLAGGGLAQARELEIVTEKRLRDRGASSAAIDIELEHLRSTFAAIEASPSSEQTWRGPTNTYKRWASYLRYAPIDDLETLAVPVFLAQGVRDEAVPVESSDAVRDRFLHLGKTNLAYHRYQDLDHTWTDLRGRARFGEVGATLLAWMTQIATPRAR
jgi:alpha-beta hydrolase superfamily lysophospholipase